MYVLAALSRVVYVHGIRIFAQTLTVRHCVSSRAAPMVRFMIKSIEDRGCQLARPVAECATIDAPVLGAFDTVDKKVRRPCMFLCGPRVHRVCVLNVTISLFKPPLSRCDRVSSVARMEGL